MVAHYAVLAQGFARPVGIDVGLAGGVVIRGEGGQTQQCIAGQLHRLLFILASQPFFVRLVDDAQVIPEVAGEVYFLIRPDEHLAGVGGRFAKVHFRLYYGRGVVHTQVVLIEAVQRRPGVEVQFAAVGGEFGAVYTAHTI